MAEAASWEIAIRVETAHAFSRKGCEVGAVATTGPVIAAVAAEGVMALPTNQQVAARQSIHLGVLRADLKL
jgi:hypothetical protein